MSTTSAPASTARSAQISCPCGKGDQHSLRDAAQCDYIRHHRGKTTDWHAGQYSKTAKRATPFIKLVTRAR